MVSVTVNPNNIPNGAAQIESNYGNNTVSHPDDPYINITSESDANDASARPDLRFVSGSYSGSGDHSEVWNQSIYLLQLEIGNRPVAPDDLINAQILLSKDLIKDTSDFVLRNLILVAMELVKVFLLEKP